MYLGIALLIGILCLAFARPFRVKDDPEDDRDLFI